MDQQMNSSQFSTSSARRRKPLRPWSLSSREQREKNPVFEDNFNDEANPIEEQTKKQRRSDSNKSKIHRCRQCSFVSENKEDFWTHQRLHIRPEKLLECPDCPFVTEYKHHLEYHLRNHAGSKPFKCSKCDYACVNLSMLRSHKKSHYRHLLFKCADCSFESKDFSTIEEHLQIEGHQLHRDFQVDEFLQEHFSSILPKRNKKSIVEQETNRTLQCQFCDFQTESTDFFQIHLVQHTFDQWIEFFQGQKFNLEQLNNSPMSTDRETQVDQWQLQGLFECSHCQMIFKDFSMYCTHKQFHSSANNPFRCAQCGEQKRNQYDFFVHITQQAHDLS